jgi:hypothetical protein
MSNHESSQPSAPIPAERSFLVSFLLQQLPYLILIVLALIGITYTGVSPQASLWYWQALAPVYGLVCIASKWGRAGAQGESRVRLVGTQLLHWGAFLITMRLVFLPVVQRNLDSHVSGFILLHLLALSTFLAGIYVDWRLVIVGVFLALGLVVTAFFEQATGLIVVVLTVVMVGTLLIWAKFARQRSP